MNNPQAYSLATRAYLLFKAGNDTLKISHILGITEARAHLLISTERAARLGYTLSYERRA